MLSTTYLFVLAGGGLIGFLLGLLGGGGSLLAVPLLLQIGGVQSVHMAIGTSAFAVAVNAVLGSVNHARKGNVSWRPALIFSAAGILAAVIGALYGLQTPSKTLMILFGALTVTVGLWMAIKKNNATAAGLVCNQGWCSKVVISGLGVGAISGFFGIGGGFMVVPAMLWATGLPMVQVVGTSLVGVGALGLGTAATYALAQQVVWPVAGLLIIGGVVGSHLGVRLASELQARSKNVLRYIFSGFIMLVGLYIILQHYT